MTRLLTILLVISALCASCPTRSQNEPEVYARKSMDAFAANARRDYGVSLHSNTGAFHDKIYHFAFDFYVMEDKSIDEMRELMYSLVHDFETHANQDQQLKPYLAKDPINTDMLTIQLTVVKRGSNNLTTVILKNDVIYFYFTKGKEVEVVEEQFSEAVVRR